MLEQNNQYKTKPGRSNINLWRSVWIYKRCQFDGLRDKSIHGLSCRSFLSGHKFSSTSQRIFASNIRPNCVACFLLHHHNVLSCYSWVILYYIKCSITERLFVLFQIRHCVSYTCVWIIAILRNVVQNRWNVFRFNCKVQSKEFCVKRTLLYLAICIEAFVQWI